MANDKNPIVVSVIIPTFNSAKTIGACLDSILHQDYDDIEIIVVDNFSVDETAKIVTSKGARLISHGCGRALARNIGAEQSIGKFILNIDSDMELAPKLISECVYICESQGIESLIIPEISFGDGYLSKCRIIEKRMLINQTGYESSRFVSAIALKNIHGYDCLLESGEDYDIHNRLIENRYKIGRTSCNIFHNEGYLTTSSLISKFRKYGETIDCYVEKNEKFIKMQKRLPSIYIDNYQLLIKNIHLIPGLLFIHMMSYFFTTKHFDK